MKISSELQWVAVATRDDTLDKGEWPDIQISAMLMLRVENVRMTFARKEDHRWELTETLFTGQKYLKVGKTERVSAASRYSGNRLPIDYHWLHDILAEDASNNWLKT